MPYSFEHPSDWTLELLAEDALGPDEAAKVRAHVDSCVQCGAEVEAYRAVFASLAMMPTFEPSSGFADSVMARVQVAPQPAMAQWLVRWLPATRRGWTLLLGLAMAPALPLLALVGWIVADPLVTAGGLWQLTTGWTRDVGWSILVEALGGLVDSNLVYAARLAVGRLLAVPVEILVGGALLFAVGIPFSVYTLYRTLRAPRGETTYAQ